MSSLGKLNTTLKTGQESLHYNGKNLQFTLLSFWRWCLSDIMSNSTRGIFSEFIVASATNIDLTKVRDEWSAYDLETPDGIKLQIKSCAYLQTWHQEKLSNISFGIKATRYWDSDTNIFSSEAKLHADVYIFCLLHHENKETVDPFNLNQWEFYVLASEEVNEFTYRQRSIALKTLQRLTKAVSYEKLYDEIKMKNRSSKQNKTP